MNKATKPLIYDILRKSARGLKPYELHSILLHEYGCMLSCSVLERKLRDYRQKEGLIDIRPPKSSKQTAWTWHWIGVDMASGRSK